MPPGNNTSIPITDTDVSSRDALSDAILAYIRNLPPPNNNSYKSRQLMHIIDRLDDWGKQRSLIELSEYMNAIFPVAVTERPPAASTG